MRPWSVISLVLLLGCDRDPEPPTGGLWEPCIPIELECEAAEHYCHTVGGSEASVCVPKCSLEEACPDAPGSVPVRCDASEVTPNSTCVVDCISTLECPEGMVCLFDEPQSTRTGKGVCAWLDRD